MFPALLFALSRFLTNAQGPYYLGNNSDPEYCYLFNALNLLNLWRPTHVHHPGTTVQIFGALISGLHWAISCIFGQWEPLQHSVLTNPEEYLLVINFSLNLILALGGYLAGREVLRRSGSLTAAMTLQGGMFLFLQAMLATMHVSPEPALMVTLFLFSIPWIAYIQNARQPGDRPYLAMALGAVVGAGLVTKVIFLPFILVVFLFSTRRERLLFCTAASCTAAILLFPIYPHLRQMVAFHIGNLVHKGRYGSGDPGFVATTAFAKNILLLWHAEPLVFLLPCYYCIVLAAIFGKSAVHSPQARILTRFIVISMAGIAVGITLAIKSPAPRYLLTAGCLAVLANTAIVLLLREAELSMRLRMTLGIAGLFLLVGGAGNNMMRLFEWKRDIQLYRERIQMVDAKLDSMSNCTRVGMYRSSLPSFALAFGNSYAQYHYTDALTKLYPDAIQLTWVPQSVERFGTSMEWNDLLESMHSGRCYAVQGWPVPGLPAALSVEPVIKGVEAGTCDPDVTPCLEGLFRLVPSNQH